MNAIAKTTAAETFRNKASGLLGKVANLTLYELVDEFQRLTSVMDENCTPNEDGYGVSLNDEAMVASRERSIINGAAKARFGIEFGAHDRRSSGSDADF